jgi:CRP/FNR family cyclic AMP-dependent transcriptional regulator
MPWHPSVEVDPALSKAISRSFLSTLPDELVERLTAKSELVDYPAGTTFYREGDRPRTMLVVTGVIRVFLSSSEGRQVTVRYARSGEALGIPLAIGGPLNVRAQALTPSSLFTLDVSTLVETARQDARVALALAEELTRRLDDTLQQTAINAFGSVKQRVATHLLDLASSEQDRGGSLVARVSQQELADAVGSVREVVARVLRGLRLSGIVATSPDSVLIVDPVRLHEESWGSAGS